MKDETKRFIEDLTGRILQHYDIGISVRDIRKAVKKTGGTVTEDPELPPYDRIILQKTGDRSFSIRIPAKQREVQKTFAIARGLGHLFLHMGFGTCRELWEQQPTERNMLFGQFESLRTADALLQIEQVNYFAMSLLMPKYQFTDAIHKYEESGNCS